jgi:predicted permease
MKLWASIRSFASKFFHRSNLEGEMEEELRVHIENRADDLERGGLPRDEATRRARVEFGGCEKFKEQCREEQRGFWIETVRSDARFGLRMLRKSPGFTAVAVLTLALGIGANTAIFTVVHAVLLNPLPYPESERLAILEFGIGNEHRAPASGYQLEQIRERSRLFEQVGGIWVTNSVVPGEGEPEQVRLGLVTDNFLSLLCAKPAAGRLFSHEDAQSNVPSALIISYALWQRRFGGDPGVIGRALRAAEGSITVVGVLPQDFRLIFPDDQNVPLNVDLFVPLQGDYTKPGGPSFIHTIARLSRGASFAQAQVEADEIAAQLRRIDPQLTQDNFSIDVATLHDDDVRNVRRTILLLFGGVAFVLVIACANVANLLLARGGARMRETTIRTALGAPRSRTIRQLLTESIVLGLFGGVAAIAVGWGALQGLLALRPESLLRLATIRLDVTVFLYTLAISVLTGIVFGLVPAFTASRVDLIAGLRGAGRGATLQKQRSRALLICSEVALSFALLAGTALLVRTFISVLRVNPGFQAKNVLTFTTSLGDYNFVRQLQRGLLTIPGVQSASLVSHLPLDDSHGNWYDAYYPEGTPPAEQSSNLADSRSILPGYFATIGATLIKGRDFTDADDAAHQHVAIIDDALAQQTWPGQEPLGRKLNTSDSPKGPYQFERDWVVVIGVVKHMQYQSLTTMGRPQIYVPYQLAPRPISFVVRSEGPAASLLGPIREQVAKLNKNAPVARVITLDELVEHARTQNRFVAFLAGALAGIALLLACIGIAGVTSYSIVQRTGEIGIRVTLGARPAEILRMVLSQNFAPVAVGLAAGLVLSMAIAPLLRGLLFGVEPGDPLNYAAVLAFLALVGALACYFPARQATRVDPLITLRYE